MLNPVNQTVILGMVGGLAYRGRTHSRNRIDLWLGFHVWDYTSLPFNFWGQICLGYSLLWGLLTCIGIVLFDILGWKLFGESRPWYTWRFKKDGHSLK